jgi:hypothetical protein
MKFVLPQSLFQGACSQKVLKNLKIKCEKVMLSKTSLSAVPTFSLLGVKFYNFFKYYLDVVSSINP